MDVDITVDEGEELDNGDCSQDPKESHNLRPGSRQNEPNHQPNHQSSLNMGNEESFQQYDQDEIPGSHVRASGLLTPTDNFLPTNSQEPQKLEQTPCVELRMARNAITHLPTPNTSIPNHGDTRKGIYTPLSTFGQDTGQNSVTSTSLIHHREHMANIDAKIHKHPSIVHCIMSIPTANCCQIVTCLIDTGALAGDLCSETITQWIKQQGGQAQPSLPCLVCSPISQQCVICSTNSYPVIIEFQNNLKKKFRIETNLLQTNFYSTPYQIVLGINTIIKYNFLNLLLPSVSGAAGSGGCWGLINPTDYTQLSETASNPNLEPAADQRPI
jgi:hypothetical protein